MSLKMIEVSVLPIMLAIMLHVYGQIYLDCETSLDCGHASCIKATRYHFARHSRADKMQKIPSVKLNSGYDIPILGLGTWQAKPGEVGTAVENAIAAGYRHIDCAMVYENEREVGQAIAAKIKDGTVTREQLFITSKLWCTYHEPEQVEVGCRQTLADLGLDYLDLYLIHFPIGFKQKSGSTSERDANNQIIMTDCDYLDTWLAMEQLVKKGLVRSIGISNFNVAMLERILEKGTIPPATNQVECHPYLNQTAFRAAHKAKGVTITAYSPFANPNRAWAKPDEPKLMEDPKIVNVAKKHGKTPAQVLLRYQIQLGNITIPKSVTPTRLQENLLIFDFQLSDEEMASIGSLECNGRVGRMDFCRGHKYYPHDD